MKVFNEEYLSPYWDPRLMIADFWCLDKSEHSLRNYWSIHKMSLFSFEEISWKVKVSIFISSLIGEATEMLKRSYWWVLFCQRKHIEKIWLALRTNGKRCVLLNPSSDRAVSLCTEQIDSFNMTLPTWSPLNTVWSILMKE